ncbi:S28 family serine protease [Streptomyces kutzneri]|uniref:S28 family serine protease n=1 Tax=Streptomyces kutzneri TaxID=3051179 RepID=UPI0028D83715|nr:S28 family serine protease [Streptomyces sp. DSM 40907]
MARERQKHRTVRRWGAAAVAVLVLAAGGTAAGAGTAVAAAGDIRERLAAVPGVTVGEQRVLDGGDRQYTLTFRQWADHRDHSRGSFEQRLNLIHHALDAPTVLYSTGYELDEGEGVSEPTRLLGGNELKIEHRFFGPSTPAAPDWSTLTVRQAADDYHAVVTALKLVYRQKWIGTGWSKGGMASVYHRRFHPRDVDGTIAYVAPHDVDDADDRSYDRFLANVGTPECRAGVQRVSRQLLGQRDALAARYDAWAKGEGYTYTATFGTADRAVEFMAMESVFSYWMLWGEEGCDKVPVANAGLDTLWGWLHFTLGGLDGYTDQRIGAHAAYYYQAATQIGRPSPAFPWLADLRRYPDVYDVRNQLPGPLRDAPFDRGTMRDVQDWIDRDGSRLLFVYGQWDPWGSERFSVGRRTRDSAVLTVPRATHGTTALSGLPGPERVRAEGMLKRWARSR